MAPPTCPICGDGLAALKSDSLKAIWGYEKSCRWSSAASGWPVGFIVCLATTSYVLNIVGLRTVGVRGVGLQTSRRDMGTF